MWPRLTNKVTGGKDNALALHTCHRKKTMELTENKNKTLLPFPPPARYTQQKRNDEGSFKGSKLKEDITTQVGAQGRCDTGGSEDFHLPPFYHHDHEAAVAADFFHPLCFAPSYLCY